MKVTLGKMDLVVGGYSVLCYLSLLLERSKKKNIWKSPEFLVNGFKIFITDIFTFATYKKITPNFNSFKLSFPPFLKFHISLMHFLVSPAVEENNNFSQRLLCM